MDDIEIEREDHALTSDQKIKWLGYGEWVEELDFINFKYKDHSCSIQRVFMKEPFSKEECYFGGHLCGYVKIPEDSPLFRKEEIDSIHCHGGITYNELNNEFFPFFTNDSHIIGFDCAHSGDIVPSVVLMKKKRTDDLSEIIFPIPEEFKQFSIFNPEYRNLQFCIDQCKEIVDQLIQVKVND